MNVGTIYKLYLVLSDTNEYTPVWDSVNELLHNMDDDVLDWSGDAAVDFQGVVLKVFLPAFSVGIVPIREKIFELGYFDKCLTSLGQEYQYYDERYREGDFLNEVHT